MLHKTKTTKKKPRFQLQLRIILTNSKGPMKSFVIGCVSTQSQNRDFEAGFEIRVFTTRFLEKI